MIVGDSESEGPVPLPLASCEGVSVLLNDMTMLPAEIDIVDRDGLAVMLRRCFPNFVIDAVRVREEVSPFVAVFVCEYDDDVDSVAVRDAEELCVRDIGESDNEGGL